MRSLLFLPPSIDNYYLVRVTKLADGSQDLGQKIYVDLPLRTRVPLSLFSLSRSQVRDGRGLMGGSAATLGEGNTWHAVATAHDGASRASGARGGERVIRSRRRIVS